MDFPVSDKGDYCFGPFRLGPNRRLLLRDGKPVKIQPRLFDTLAYLVLHADRLVEKDELIAAVWPGRVIEDNNLTQSISSLRRVLQAEGSGETYIVTVPNRGYRFVAPIRLERLYPDTGAPAHGAAGWTPEAGKRHYVWPLAAGLGIAAIALAAILSLASHKADHKAAPATEAIFHPPPHSVAVLAFTNMSGDARQEYFSDGVSEELIDTLGRLDGIKVAARVSAFSFKGSSATAAEIGRTLNVGAVLEGSVRRDGDTVRITADLIDTATGFQLWSDHYDRSRDNLLHMQEDIAQHVTQSLRVRLLGDAPAQLTLGGTANGQAFDAYLRGRSIADPSLTARDTLADEKAALALYDQALSLDPHYAMAEAARAVILCDFSGSGQHAPQERQQLEDDALRAARHAVSMAPDLGMAQAQLAYVLEVCAFDFAGAGAALSRAVALAPGNADVLSAASSLAAQTHPDRGLPIAQLLVTLDPLNPQSYDRLAEAFYWSRRYDEAASALDHAVLLRGGATVAEAVRRGMIALMRGDPAAAAAICAGERSWRENLILALADHQLGRLREAAIQAGRVHDALHDAGAYQYAELAAQWGKPDEALGWLETAVRLRDHGLTRISVDQFLDPVRDTPRFGAVVRALNLPK